MSYLENHFDKRLDTTLLMPGTKSVISLLYNHFPQTQQDQSTYKIAKYAYGKDYHKVIKKRLKPLTDLITALNNKASFRVFVDSAPIMERQWAQKSGLGWIGKNTLLINKQKGSYFFLAEILVDFELEYDSAIADHCGTCTRCLEACPTDAFPEPYMLDASKCISYATIELKDEIPSLFEGKMEDWIFGCDICQDVCPWNRFSDPHSEEAFEAKVETLHFKKKDWQDLDEEKFDEIFSGSAVKRTKFEGLKRNIDFVRNSKPS